MTSPSPVFDKEQLGFFGSTGYGFMALGCKGAQRLYFGCTLFNKAPYEKRN
jgi:hypothetical protein